MQRVYQGQEGDDRGTEEVPQRVCPQERSREGGRFDALHGLHPLLLRGGAERDWDEEHAREPRHWLCDERDQRDDSQRGRGPEGRALHHRVERGPRAGLQVFERADDGAGDERESGLPLQE